MNPAEKSLARPLLYKMKTVIPSKHASVKHVPVKTGNGEGIQSFRRQPPHSKASFPRKRESRVSLDNLRIPKTAL